MEPKIDESGIYSQRTLVTVFLVTSAIAVGVVGAYAPTDWSWLRVFAAGGLIGALAFISVFVNHLLIPTHEA